MAYHVDPIDNSIVIDSFNQGIGASPYSGLTDLRSVEIDSVSGEANVNFSTQSASQAPNYPTTAPVTSATLQTSSYYINIPTSLKLETNQWIIFTTLGGATGSGLAINTPYRLSYQNVSGANSQYQLYTVAGAQVTVTGASSTTVTFSTINPTKPKFFAQASIANFMIDDSGRVWTDYTSFRTNGAGTITATHSWGWTGNTSNNIGSAVATTDAHGNGLVYWRTANSTYPGSWDGWLLIFRDGEIDYCNVDGNVNQVAYENVGTYTYGWNPKTGNTGNSSYLQGFNQSGCPHNAIIGPDGRVYFCDLYNVNKLYQADLVTPTTFDPGTQATYGYNIYNLLPINDIATCIAPLGTNYVIGGIHNQAYQWDSTSNFVLNAILLAESYVFNVITVNTNAYLFVGNTGRIYVTNGSQANPYVKIPDHLSNTVSPYFAWGGATYTKNKLYFSALAVTNSGGNITGYGGLWAVTLTQNPAIYLSNQLSYGTYGGYASALAAIPLMFASPGTIPTEPAGIGMLIGWYDGVSVYGIDTTISTPYTGGQSWVTSDMIPVGTLFKPTTLLQIEFKLAQPLVTGETVQIQTGKYLDMSYASFTSQFTTNSTGILSDNSADHGGMKDQQYQWILVRAILTSTATNPSYNRIKELRILGATKKQTSYQAIE